MLYYIVKQEVSPGRKRWQLCWMNTVNRNNPLIKQKSEGDWTRIRALMHACTMAVPNARVIYFDENRYAKAYLFIFIPFLHSYLAGLLNPQASLNWLPACWPLLCHSPEISYCLVLFGTFDSSFIPRFVMQ